MSIPAHKSRPGDGPEAAESVVTTHDQDTGRTAAPHLSLDEIAASHPGYVLIVKTPSARITRRVFLSLHAAVKATERAEARGHATSLTLCRVVPYLTGSDLHGTAVIAGE